MKPVTRILSKLLLLGFSTLLVTTSVLAEEAIKIDRIEAVINPIFDLEQDDAWLFKTANQLHVDTKPEVIKRILPIKTGDKVTQRDITEAERILRRHRYLRDAKITVKTNSEGETVLVVNSWENWTLFPTVDLNRQGGETQYSYGIKDDNLLGLGVAANIAYFSEADRTGHILSLQSDAISDQHIQAGLVLADNSDGEQLKLSLVKPFYALSERHSFGLVLDKHRQDISVDVNEILVNRFESDKEFLEAFFGYSTGKTGTGVYRWILGITHEEYEFNPLLETAILAEDRSFTYPWLAFEYQQDRFTTTKNLYLLERKEDIQLGWYHYVKLGINTDSSYRQSAWLWKLYSGYFGQWNQQHWYRYGISGEGVYSTKAVTNAYYQGFYEHFYRVNDFRTWYLKANYKAYENPYIDRPMVLGGESGLRGYPLEYQHGKKQWLLTLEKRFYPQINIAQLLDVAFVGFVDAGKSFGESYYPNPEQGMLASAGMGLRFFLTRSSGRNVISINFSQPLNSEFVKDFDVSVIVRGSF